MTKTLADIDAKLKRVTQAIKQVGICPTLEDRLRSLETERETVRRALRTLPLNDAKLPMAIPEFGARWRNAVANLDAVSGHAAGDTSKAKDALSKLLGNVKLLRAGDHLEAELKLEPKRAGANGQPFRVANKSRNFGSAGAL